MVPNPRQEDAVLDAITFCQRKTHLSLLTVMLRKSIQYVANARSTCLRCF